MHPLFQIFTVAVAVSFWYRKRADFHSFSSIREFEIETSHLLSHNCDNQQEEKSGTSAFPAQRCSYIEKVTGLFLIYSVLINSHLLKRYL